MNLKIEPAVEGVLARLQAATGSKNDAELARRLGVSPSTVSAWRNRLVVPYAECVTIAVEKGVSLDKLIFGQDNHRRLDSELLRKCVEHWLSLYRLHQAPPDVIGNGVAKDYMNFYDQIYGINKYSEKAVPREQVFAHLQQSIDFNNRFAAESSKAK